MITVPSLIHFKISGTVRDLEFNLPEPPKK